MIIVVSESYIVVNNNYNYIYNIIIDHNIFNLEKKLNVDITTFQIFQAFKTGLLYPANEFMDDNDIINVCNKFNLSNNFFPIPLFISANKEDIRNIRNNVLDLSYKNKIFGSIKVKKIFTFDKNTIENTIFKNKIGHHPYKSLLKVQKEFFLNGEIINKISTKKKIKKKSLLIGFSTRNVPHIGHKKIILNQVNKGRKIIVAIFNNPSDKSDYQSKLAYSSYNIFIKKYNLKKKVSVRKITMPGFLLGPRQAALQAMIMKNIGCEGFIVGRDHSGYKKFYKENDSYIFCKKNEKKIGIKIYKSGSPFYCLKCQKVMLRNECNCWKKNKKFFIDISSTFINKVKKSRKLKKKFKNLFN